MVNLQWQEDARLRARGGVGIKLSRKNLCQFSETEGNRELVHTSHEQQHRTEL